MGRYARGFDISGLCGLGMMQVVEHFQFEGSWPLLRDLSQMSLQSLWEVGHARQRAPKERPDGPGALLVDGLKTAFCSLW